MKTAKPQYRIEREGALEYVVVECPYGHLSRGQKAIDMKIKQELTCTNTNCNIQWTVLAPATNGMEACI